MAVYQCRGLDAAGRDGTRRDFGDLMPMKGEVSCEGRRIEQENFRSFGIPSDVLKGELKGRFIDHGDPRLTEVMKGYVMRALFFHLTGNPFCDHPDCRLYNAHWQEELIRAQLDGKYEFCRDHRKSLNRDPSPRTAGQKEWIPLQGVTER